MFERDSSNMNIYLASIQNLNFIYVNVLFNGELIKETPLITLDAPQPESEAKFKLPLEMFVLIYASSIKPILIQQVPPNGLLNVQVSS